MKVSAREEIRSDRDSVFTVFTDLEGAVQRIEGIKSIEFLSEEKSGLGVRWRETRVMFGKEATEDMQITALTEPDSYVVEAESHGTHYTSVFSFRDSEAGTTEVTWEFEGRPLSLFAKIMAPLGFLMWGSMRKMLQKDLADLKQSIEA
jgi:carbon monoxide dehydrogenase subunit G